MSDQESKPGRKKSFDVDQIPVETRKIIYVVSLVLIMVVIFAVWLPFAIKSINDSSAQGNGELSGVGTDLENFLNELKSKTENIGSNLNDLQNNLKQDKQEQVKDGVVEVLSNQLTADWAEYTDLSNRFTIKYPNDFLLSTSSDLVFELSQKGTTTPVLEIKKFVSYGSLTNMINIKKIVQRPDHILAFFDYSNSTTTNLIINSFKSIDNNL